MTGGNYIKEGLDSSKSTCLIFSPPKSGEVGALERYLKIFSENSINLIHIESRPSTRFPSQYEFMVECAPSGDLGTAILALKQQTEYFSIISRNHKDNSGKEILLSYKHTKTYQIFFVLKQIQCHGFHDVFVIWIDLQIKFYRTVQN